MDDVRPDDRRSAPAYALMALHHETREETSMRSRDRFSMSIQEAHEARERAERAESERDALAEELEAARADASDCCDGYEGQMQMLQVINQNLRSELEAAQGERSSIIERLYADLAREQERARSAEDQLTERMTWHPIETAPKDGTWVLLGWSGTREVVSANWSNEFGVWLDEMVYDACNDPPTHWMIELPIPDDGP